MNTEGGGWEVKKEREKLREISALGIDDQERRPDKEVGVVVFAQ